MTPPPKPHPTPHLIFLHSFKPLACHDIFLILSYSGFSAVAGGCASRVAGFFKHQQELPLREGASQERKRKKEVRGARRAADRALRLSPQMVIVWNSRVMISCCALSLYLADAVGYELIKRNISLDIVSTLRSDYGATAPHPRQTEIT